MEPAHGFFASRQALKLPRRGGGSSVIFAEYVNVSPIIGALISHRMASLYELDTHLGVRDAYDLLEIVAVDNYNSALLHEKRQG